MPRAMVLAIAFAATAAAQPNVTIEPASDATGKRGQLLLDIVARAFQVDKKYVVAPEWFGKARYDVSIEADDADPLELLREGLMQKFQMAVHWEVRPYQVLVLRRPPYARDLPPANDRRLSASYGAGRFEGAATGSSLAWALGINLRHEIVDETGIKNFFSASLSWDEGDINSLVSALRNELGIEMLLEWRDLSVLVIDAALRPDPEQPARHPCAADPTLAAAIEALPPMEDLTRSWEQRMATRRELAEHYRSSIIAAMAVQDAFRGKSYLSRDWDWALSLYRYMTDRAAGMILEARLIGRLQPSRARWLLTLAAGQAPDSPWVYLGFAELDVEVDVNLDEFRRACPNSLADAALYEKATDPVLLRSAAASLSRAAAARNTTEAVAAYPHIWRLRRRT